MENKNLFGLFRKTKQELLEILKNEELTPQQKTFINNLIAFKEKAQQQKI